jgi:protocatechuate 3,4-dioxygenase beta subunit
MNRLDRRQALRLLAAAPIGAALSSCAEPFVGTDGGFTIGNDAGNGGTDAGPGDAGAMVDAGPEVCELSERDALGPFYEGGAPMRTMIALPTEPGDRLLVQGTLVDVADCRTPLGGYIVDIWQADAEGNYYMAGTTDYRLRGRIATGPDGRFSFETIKPGWYMTTAGPRPAHLHARIFTPGGMDRLVTQIYFEGDEFLGPNDGCQPPTCFSGDPLRTMRLEPAKVGGVNGFRSQLRLIVSR